MCVNFKLKMKNLLSWKRWNVSYLLFDKYITLSPEKSLSQYSIWQQRKQPRFSKEP